MAARTAHDARHGDALRFDPQSDMAVLFRPTPAMDAIADPELSSVASKTPYLRLAQCGQKACVLLRSA